MNTRTKFKKNKNKFGKHLLFQAPVLTKILFEIEAELLARLAHSLSAYVYVHRIRVSPFKCHTFWKRAELPMVN